MEPSMTLSEQAFAPALRDDIVPVLATARLVLRAPRRSDVKAIASLANDRRIAANTAPIPHPYRIEDAEQFIAAVLDAVGMRNARGIRGNAAIVFRIPTASRTPSNSSPPSTNAKAKRASS